MKKQATKRKVSDRQRLAYDILVESGFFSRIASKGGKTTVETHGSEHMKAIGALGGKSSGPDKRPVAMYTLSGKLRRVYSSLDEAERATKVAKSNIVHVASGRRKSAGGYRWQYVEGSL